MVFQDLCLLGLGTRAVTGVAFTGHPPALLRTHGERVGDKRVPEGEHQGGNAWNIAPRGETGSTGRGRGEGGRSAPRRKSPPMEKKGLLNALGEMLEKRKLVRLVKMCHLGSA